MKKITLADENVPHKEFDLCRFGGEYHTYITELSDISVETYIDFKKRVKKNTAAFDKDKVTYSTYFGNISSSYNGEFSLNGVPQSKEFSRYDCIFCKAERKAGKIVVDSGKNILKMSLRQIG